LERIAIKPEYHKVPDKYEGCYQLKPPQRVPHLAPHTNYVVC